VREGETGFWWNVVLKRGVGTMAEQMALGSVSALQNFPDGISEGKDNFWH
jgi:hypothetical protein